MAEVEQQASFTNIYSIFALMFVSCFLARTVAFLGSGLIYFREFSVFRFHNFSKGLAWMWKLGKESCIVVVLVFVFCLLTQVFVLLLCLNFCDLELVLTLSSNHPTLSPSCVEFFGTLWLLSFIPAYRVLLHGEGFVSFVGSVGTHTLTITIVLPFTHVPILEVINTRGNWALKHDWNRI